MNTEDLKKHINKKSFLPAYLIYGPEEFMKEYYTKKLSEAIVTGAPEFNSFVVTDIKTQMEEALSFSLMPPMGSEHKLILFKNTGVFSSASEEIKETVSELIDDELVICVFCEEAVDKRSVLYKKISKMGTDVEFTLLSPVDLRNRVKRKIIDANKKIEEKTLLYLMDRLPKDMHGVRNETDKLIYYVEGDTIKESDIDKLISKDVSDRVFEMTEALMLFDSENAFLRMEELKFLKESGVKVLSLIARQISLVLRKKTNPTESLGLMPFIEKKYSNQAKKRSEENLIKLLKLSQEYDRKIKAGEIDEWLAVELLSVKMLLK